MSYGSALMDIQQFEERKKEHIRHALDTAHQASGLGGLDEIQLIHEALPDLDFEEVSLETSCLGIKLKTPFYIAGMTAGHADAFELNRSLAHAAQTRGWAMGVGSQRRDLENSGEKASGETLDQWKRLRQDAPDLVLFGNVGISQITSVSISKIRSLVDAIGAQALAVHANALQECLQPEGTPQFRGALSALKTLCRELGVPVILKETGCGFSEATLGRLADCGLGAVDVSGLGGTHWGRIEGARAARQGDETLQFRAAQTLANWGVSTADSVINGFKKLKPQTEIWASGGVRSGLESAKLIALGAHRVGYAKPALEAALQGAHQLNAWMERQEFELKVALFCTGMSRPGALRGKEGVWKKSGS